MIYNNQIPKTNFNKTFAFILVPVVLWTTKKENSQVPDKFILSNPDCFVSNVDQIVSGDTEYCAFYNTLSAQCFHQQKWNNQFVLLMLIQTIFLKEILPS